MVRLHEAGELAQEFETAYFSSPRPVWELYDLQEDPGELVNLAGLPELQDVENELRRVLHEKMVIDYDFSAGLPKPTWAGDYPHTSASYISQSENKSLVELGHLEPEKAGQLAD